MHAAVAPGGRLLHLRSVRRSNDAGGLGALQMASAVRCRDQGEPARGITSDLRRWLGAAATARLSARLGVAADAGDMIGFVDAWKLLDGEPRAG